ncbi:hypothetical protein C8D88_116119 [Lentzea atacamensis]|uniref:Right handed beta helix region n=1 Tax=Lentzea atacamensis TaxID=531938 RepID=A0A316HNT8_9PSEU|nr:hypothetical protein [Lentzea atacamensis]PWK81707.1 hypothetical protein C8D88_116119 [Lentzea atacamensis]
MKVRRILAPLIAVIVVVSGISFAAAQTEPVPTAPLGTWCPPLPSNATAGQPVQCKVVADPDWTAPTSTTTVPPTTTTTTTTTVAPTTTVPTTTVPTTTPPATTTTQPPASLMGWQLTADNVGLKPHGLSCASLPLYIGPAKPLAGNTISGYRIEQPLDLSNGNLLIEKSCIKPSTVGYHNSFLVTTTVCSGNSCSATTAGNVTIRDSEITADHLSAGTIAKSCAFLGVGTLQRNYMHGMGSGICFFETGTVHSALAEHNYVRGLRSSGDSHNEAATIRDFRNATGRTVKFLNNRLDCSSGNATGGLFIQPTWLPIYNVTIQGNYLEGEGYNLYLERTGNATYGNVRAINNRFRPTGWGASATPSGPGYAEWRDNHIYDAAKPDGKGAVLNP